ncbi:hypothetical protein Tco_1302199 [Tanacetum coccineum]
MIRGGRSQKRPFKGERSGLTEELTFPAIPQGHFTDRPIILEGMIEGHHVQRIYVDGGSSSEIMYEHCFRNFNTGIRSRLRKCKAPLVGFSGKTYHPLGIVEDRNEESQSSRIYHPFYDQIPNNPWNHNNETSREAFWLKEGIIRKVRHPEWVANVIPIRLESGAWKVQVDYSSLNKVCAKDMYPFLEEGKELIEGNYAPEMRQERKYKEEIMDATASFHKFRITHLPKTLNPKAKVLTGLATIKLEFLNQEVSVGIKTRPSAEETSSNKKGKAVSNVPGAKPTTTGRQVEVIE